MSIPRSTGPGCLGKIAYATRADADKAKRHLHERPAYIKGGAGKHGALTTYHCDKCGSFHLGRNRRAGRKELKKVPDYSPQSFKSRKARYTELAE